MISGLRALLQIEAGIEERVTWDTLGRAPPYEVQQGDADVLAVAPQVAPVVGGMEQRMRAEAAAGALDYVVLSRIDVGQGRVQLAEVPALVEEQAASDILDRLEASSSSAISVQSVSLSRSTPTHPDGPR